MIQEPRREAQAGADAYLRFEGAVQEIFDVLHGIRYPEMMLIPQAETASTYVLPEAAMAELAFTG